MAFSKENRDSWISKMVEFGMRCAEKNIWDEYFSYGGIGAYINTDYRIINYEALRRNIEKYTEISDDKHNDVGALVWAFLKKCQKDEKEDISKSKKNNIDFRKRHKVVDVLSRFDFDLSTRDRLAVMNFFDFSSFTPMYKLLYNRIGKFEIDKNSKDIEFEKKHAVKLFHDVLNSLRKSKNNKQLKAISIDTKLECFKSFLESVANNSDVLEDAQYISEENKKGKKNIEILRISDFEKSELLDFIKNSNVKFSPECMNFLGNRDQKSEHGSYLRIILNKLHEAEKPISDKEERKIIPSQQEYVDCYKAKLSIYRQNNDRLSSVLAKQDIVSDETVLFYAKYITDFASIDYSNKSINTDILMNLVDKNLENKNNKKKAESLFPDEEEAIKDNKELVFDVATIYANSFNCSEPEAEEFNPYFHKEMTKMFIKIAKSQRFNVKDINQLCGRLEENQDKAMKEMTRSIKISAGLGGNSGNVGNASSLVR